MIDAAIQVAQMHYERYKAAFPLAANMVQQICNDYNLIIDEFPMENQRFTGMLWNDDGQYTILLNPSLPRTRRLFTLTHELGHYLMHRWYQPAFFCTRINGQAFDLKERQANVFAAELLMPLEKIQKLARAGFDIKKAAAFMGVSEQALQYRVKELRARQKKNKELKVVMD